MTILRKWSGRQVLGLCLAAAVTGGLGGCPPSGNGGGTLAGTWTGDVTYEANIVVNDQPSGEPFEKSLTVTFDEQGQPGILDLATANGSQVVYLSTAKLVDPGNSDEQTFTVQSPTGKLKTLNVAATVTSVSRSPTAFSMALDVTMEFVGSGSMSGVYTVNAALQGDGTVSWASTSDLTIDSDALPLPVRGSSTGTLRRS